MAPGSSDPLIKAADEYFDALIKSRFIEMFGCGTGNIPFESVFADFTRFGMKIPVNQYKSEGEIPIIDQGQSEIGGYIDQLEQPPFDKECIIFGDHTEKFKHITFPFYVGADGVKILCTNSSWNYVFLYFFLQIHYHPRGEYSRHFKLLKELTFFHPPLSTQNQFTDFVRQVDKSKLVFREMVSKLDKLVKSRFIEMFGDVFIGSGKWSKKSFCDIVQFNPGKNELPSDDFEVSFVPMECVGINNSMIPEGNRMKSDVIKGYTYFRDGDVVIAKITPCFENGKIAIAHNLTNGIGFGTTEFHVARPISGISNSIWILYLLLLDSLKQDANAAMTGSAGQKRIQKSYFEKLYIEIPPIELQDRFANFVKQVDKLKSEILEGVKKLRIPQ